MVNGGWWYVWYHTNLTYNIPLHIILKGMYGMVGTIPQHRYDVPYTVHRHWMKLTYLTYLLPCIPFNIIWFCTVCPWIVAWCASSRTPTIPVDRQQLKTSIGVSIRNTYQYLHCSASGYIEVNKCVDGRRTGLCQLWGNDDNHGPWTLLGDDPWTHCTILWEVPYLDESQRFV